MLCGPSPRAFSPLFALVAAVLALALPARADDGQKAECAAAYEKAQEHRTAGRLIAAEAALTLCAAEACPAFVKSDCAQWLTEVQREVPTVQFEVKGPTGDQVTAVRVFVDGELLLEELGDEPVPLDPGDHELRFEIEGAKPATRQVLVRQGHKDRVVQVSFAADPAPASTVEPPAEPSPAAADPTESAEPSAEPGPLRPYAWIAGGVGGAALVSWGVFAALGSSQQSDLESTCKPNCSSSEVDSVRTKYLIADVSLITGIVGLGAGVALYVLSQPGDPAPAGDQGRALRFDVGALPGGGFGAVGGRF